MYLLWVLHIIGQKLYLNFYYILKSLITLRLWFIYNKHLLDQANIWSKPDQTNLEKQDVLLYFM